MSMAQRQGVLHDTHGTVVTILSTHGAHIDLCNLTNKKKKKTLDKGLCMCYNTSTKREENNLNKKG